MWKLLNKVICLASLQQKYLYAIIVVVNLRRIIQNINTLECNTINHIASATAPLAGVLCTPKDKMEVECYV